MLQAEIEHFVNPDDKSHPRFPEVADLEPLLYSRCVASSLGWLAAGCGSAICKGEQPCHGSKLGKEDSPLQRYAAQQEYPI